MRPVLALLALSIPAFSASPFAGRWDCTQPAPVGGRPATWLGIAEKTGSLQVFFQPTGGHAYHVADVKADGNKLALGLTGMSWALKAANGKLTGTQISGKDSLPISCVQAPTLKRPEPKSWSAPEPLFNGKDLTGWQPLGDPAKSRWIVKDGYLLNETKGDNLASTRKFQDFKLHFEVNYPDHANSGFYLRGRYEVQLESEPLADNPPERRIGAIYGRITPKGDLPGKIGVWETFDITLVGRIVTIARNGVTTIDHQEIEGITGGALDSNEAEPGPFYIQGDHTGGLKFRNITIQH